MKNKIRSLITHQFVKGSFIFTISNFIISLLNYFFNFLVGRTLGPSSYGEVTAFFSYITIFSIPFTIISTLIIQKISSTNLDHYAYSKSLEGWFITKIKKWWFLFIMFIFITPFIPKLTNISHITGYLIIASVIIAPFSIFYISALQGLKLFLIVAVINVITAFIKFLGSFLVSLHIDGLLTVMSFLMFSTVFNLIAVFFSFNKYVKPEKLDYKIGKRIRDAVFNRYFVLTTASIISIILLTNVDIIFSKKYFTATEAGFFAAWSLFAKIIYYLIGPFVTLTFIFFSSDKDSKDQDRILIGTLGVLTIVSFLCLIL